MIADNRALIRKLAELDPNKPVYFMYGKEEYVLTAINTEDLDGKVTESDKSILIDIRAVEALEDVILEREGMDEPYKEPEAESVAEEEAPAPVEEETVSEAVEETTEESHAEEPVEAEDTAEAPVEEETTEEVAEEAEETEKASKKG